MVSLAVVVLVGLALIYAPKTKSAGYQPVSASDQSDTEDEHVKAAHGRPCVPTSHVQSLVAQSIGESVLVLDEAARHVESTV